MSTERAVRGDVEIQRDVLDELSWDVQVPSTVIGVTVNDGVVSLTGFVESYAIRWAAESAAHRVRGVRAVANLMEVRLASGVDPDDTNIALAAMRALEWDSFIPADRLDITVANGWVMLRGEVEWGYQRRAAERELRRLRGVRGITNLIEVRPDKTVERLATARDIRAALLRRDGTDDVTVTVDGDTVTLTGAVDSWQQRDEAERVAWAAPGVRKVNDRLTVTG